MADRIVTWPVCIEMMKTLSRHKSAAEGQKLTPLCYACLLALVFGVAWLCYVCPVVLIAGVPLAALVWALSLFERHEHKKMAACRLEVNIRALTDSLESRRVDGRLIRAVYEELQKRCKGERRLYPIRASDRVQEDLGIGWDVLCDVACEIAARTGYDSAGRERNPLFNGLKTVEDLVLFFTHLTRKSKTEQQSALTADRVDIGRTLSPETRLRAAS